MTKKPSTIPPEALIAAARIQHPIWIDGADLLDKMLAARWQSFDTAPKDGQLFLAWIPANRYPYIIRWVDGVGWSRDGFEAYGYPDDFTDWQPLPPPPLRKHDA